LNVLPKNTRTERERRGRGTEADARNKKDLAGLIISGRGLIKKRESKKESN